MQEWQGARGERWVTEGLERSEHLDWIAWTVQPEWVVAVLRNSSESVLYGTSFGWVMAKVGDDQYELWSAMESDMIGLDDCYGAGTAEVCPRAELVGDVLATDDDEGLECFFLACSQGLLVPTSVEIAKLAARVSPSVRPRVMGLLAQRKAEQNTRR